MFQSVDGAQCAAAFKEASMPTTTNTTTSVASPDTTSATTAAPADDNAALAAAAQQAVATIDTIEAALGADPGLSPKDKIRAAKFRKGAGPMVSTIGDLAQQQQLESPAIPVALMLSLLARANAVAPLANRLAAFVALVNDIMFAAQSQAWGMALTYYALLQRYAKTDGTLATALEPVTEFLAYRHPSTKPTVGQPTQTQVRAATKAQKALATVAGGKLANVDLLKPGATPAQAPAAGSNGASASPATANGAPVTNGGAPPAAH
jgi:hypothetical protein